MYLCVELSKTLKHNGSCGYLQTEILSTIRFEWQTIYFYWEIVIAKCALQVMYYVHFANLKTIYDIGILKLNQQ